ncbi:MAG: hypothetical protein K4571_01240 [Deltaproteobacteria bacterium]
MADKDVIKKTLDALAVLNTAIKNARLYPVTSASVSSAIEKLYLTLTDVLGHDDQIVFAESEKALLICGQSLGRKDQERPHAVSLLNILLGFGLRSLTFCKGLEKEELAQFIVLLSRSPENIHKDGGLDRLMAEQNITHILLDQKIYIAMDKDHQILSSLDITDEQISKFFLMTHPDMDPNSPQFREMIKDPEALSEIFKMGLSKMMAQKETLTSFQLSEGLNNMLSLLDKISGGLDDKKRGRLSQNVGQALLAADPAMAEQLTAQNMESMMGGLLLQYLMSELTKDKLGVTGFGGHQDARGGSAAADDSTSRLLQVSEKFGLRLQDARTLLDQELMSVLPKIIEQLIAQREQEAMDNLLERLAANLMNEKVDVRLNAARSLVDILEHLPGERKQEVIQKLSWALIAWVRRETVFYPEYQKLCADMKSKAQDHFMQRNLAEVLKYTAAFRAVADDDTGKPDLVRKTAQDAIDELASPVNIDILLDEIDSPDSQTRQDTGRLFAALGETAIEDLLNELRTKTDSDERVRIMHLIASAREKALPLIIGQITKDAPWFYLRNLAYLLGQIGSEESARALVPLLAHGNDKLRQEALKSIYRTGGSQRGRILLSALSQADEDFKSSIVDALGQAKSVEAVPVFIDLLKNRPLLTTAARMTLEEKICTALGTIGSPDAIAPLSEIASAKTFLKLRTYPEKVKTAAARALATLQRKITPAGPGAK